MSRQRSRRKRQGASQQRLVWVILGLALLAALIYAQATQEEEEPASPPAQATAAPRQSTAAPPPAAGGSLHLALGNPSGATPDAAQPNNYLISRDQYALGYSRDRGTLLWASWHLGAEDLGDVQRYAGPFITDTALPAGWFRARHGDYSGTGYDRGHMVPSADRTADVDSNTATFILSNVVPQAPANNQGPWADLENYLRDLVRDGAEVYIVAGPQGEAGTLAGGAMVIPAAVWKVAVVLPVGSDDLARVTPQTRLIAVLMPNDSGVAGRRWDDYLTTVACVEELTGLDLLSALPDPVESALAGGDCQAASGAGQPAAQPAGGTGLTIANVEYNPSGDDLVGEYVLLRNTAGAATLTGWTLSDSSGTTYTFPQFTLAAGSEVRIWVRAGADDAANLFWGRGQPVWGNYGDTAILRDPSGTEVARFAYP